MAARATETPTLNNMFLTFIASSSFIEFYRYHARTSSRSFDSFDLNRTAMTLLGNGGVGYHVILLDAITSCFYRRSLGTNTGGSASIEVDRRALEVRERAEAQRTFMCSTQHHARRASRLQSFLPPGCAQTPAITGLESRKSEFRDRRREIIAAGFRILEKSGRHDGASGMAADVL